MAPPLKWKTTLASPQAKTDSRNRLMAAFQEGWTWQEKTEQSCDYRLDGQHPTLGWIRIKQFSNGTLYIETQHEGPMDQIQGHLGAGTAPSPGAKKESRPQATTTAPPKSDGNLFMVGPYIGTDESGKGDYFGPLVVAGVLVTPETTTALEEMGVQDSKKLSPSQIKQLSVKIKEVVGQGNFAIIEISPDKYNDLYASFQAQGQNLNHLLAWGHATAIENCLTHSPIAQTTPQLEAVADQFGHPSYIEKKLKTKGKQIKLHQVHRAEANVGVAAASILARQRFVDKLQALSGLVGEQLPAGAGAPHAACAQRIVNTYGMAMLKRVAKLHFKTTQSLKLPPTDAMVPPSPGNP